MNAWFLGLLSLGLSAPDDGGPGHEIPPGAVKVALPDVRQPDGYSCGASALMAVGRNRGVGPRDVQGWKARLGTNPESGTDYRSMVRYARELGLDAAAEVGMTPGRLDSAVAAGRPVIVAIQAYADDPGAYDDPRNNENGHYVVVIGFDADHYYFEDPVLMGHRGVLSRAEFLRRWHDDEGTAEQPRVVERLGLTFGPGRADGPGPGRARRID